MKKLLSLLLTVCLLLAALTACSDGMSAAENALISLKDMDMEAFASFMTSDSDAELSRICATYEGLDEAEKATLKRVYGQLRYTMGETSEEANGKKTVSVTVKLPDIAKLRTLANAQIVFGKTANESVTELLDKGTAEIREITWEIALAEENGAWLVVYTEKANAAFLADLGLSELIGFFAKH